MRPGGRSYAGSRMGRRLKTTRQRTQHCFRPSNTPHRARHGGGLILVAISINSISMDLHTRWGLMASADTRADGFSRRALATSTARLPNPSPPPPCPRPTPFQSISPPSPSSPSAPRLHPPPARQFQTAGQDHRRMLQIRRRWQEVVDSRVEQSLQAGRQDTQPPSVAHPPCPCSGPMVALPHGGCSAGLMPPKSH